jgi:single-strand DNA-binding protein
VFNIVNIIKNKGEKMGLNKVMLIGHLGKDPETTYTQNGTAVMKFSLATTEKWNDTSTGEKREKTEWHRVTLFGRLAEAMNQYLHKGKQVYIEGKISYYQYEKDGVTMYGTDISAKSIELLGGGERQTPLQPSESRELQPPPGFNQTKTTGFHQTRNPQGGVNGFASLQPHDEMPF